MSLAPGALKLQKQVQNPLIFWFFLLAKLPAAWFAGVRLHEVNEARCVASVPYGWRSQNPFKSTYFAAQAMAAELSTGALVLLATADAPYSMLIVGMTATFGKKATALTTFTCEGGAAVFAAAKQASLTGEAQVVVLETVGRMPDGAEVSRFSFTWSMKLKSKGA